MIDVNQFNDAPSVRKEIKSLTAKVARFNMALKRAKGTDNEAKRQAMYDEAIADREALRKKLDELHAADKAVEPADAEPAAEG